MVSILSFESFKEYCYELTVARRKHQAFLPLLYLQEGKLSWLLGCSQVGDTYMRWL